MPETIEQRRERLRNNYYKNRARYCAKAREWQKKNREKVKEYQRRSAAKRRAESIAWYDALKPTLSCSCCGFSHPACMQFHHRDPASKTGNIANMVQQGASIPRLKKEMAKCDVLCANCHFILHAKERTRGVPTRGRPKPPRRWGREPLDVQGLNRLIERLS